jgi:hypothetical protein
MVEPQDVDVVAGMLAPIGVLPGHVLAEELQPVARTEESLASVFDPDRDRLTRAGEPKTVYGKGLTIQVQVFETDPVDTVVLDVELESRRRFGALARRRQQ